MSSIHSSSSSTTVASVPPPRQGLTSLSRTHSRANSIKLQKTFSAGNPHDFAAYHHDEELESELSSASAGRDVDIEKQDQPAISGSSPHSHAIDSEASRTESVNKLIVVTWDGSDDPANPRNWTKRRKWLATFVVSFYALMSTVSTSMVAPCLPQISRDLHITNEVQSQLTLSIFVLAYAIGPLVLAPTSELYGRVRALQLPNLFFLAFNLACAFAQTKGQLMGFRFLAGLGGSAPLGIGGGVLADVWPPEQRGLAVSIYSLAPLLGPAIGPIAGGFISENTTWRWAFWATTVADAVVQLVSIFLLRESFAPVLLQRKAAHLNKEAGKVIYAAPGHMKRETIGHKLRHAMIRPSKLLATQPIVQVISIYMAFIYGLMYLVLSTFPTLWTTRYHEGIGIGSLNYISLGIGFFLGSQIPARLNDIIYRRLKTKNGGTAKPEFRVPMMLPASIMVPIGLLIYGWTAQNKVHWIGPNFGAAIFAGGVIMSFQCMQTYLIEAYTTYAASAVAAATLLRSLAGFGFPLFAPYLYQALDYGWGNSLIAFIAIGLGLPAPILLWFYGPALRNRSRYAAGTLVTP